MSASASPIMSAATSPIGSPIISRTKEIVRTAAVSPVPSDQGSAIVEHEEAEVESIDLLIRPVDYGWIMGEDWTLRMPVDWTIPDVKRRVSEERDIPVDRIFLRMPDGKYIDKKKEKWTLRRHQLVDGSVLQVEPIMRGNWLWHPKEWYTEKLIRNIGELLDAAVNRSAEDHMLTVDELQKLGLFVPPPLGEISLRTFIRCYPEHFYIHHDVTNGSCWVRRAKELFTIPSVTFYPAEMATVKHFKERRFNWDKYADIDDRKRVELDFEIPDVSYNLEVLRCMDLKRADVFGSSDPLGIVYWYNCVEWKEVGRTAQRRNTLNPEWRDARYVVSVNASFEVENCKLLVEFFDVDAGDPGEADEIGDYLGCSLITGRLLQRLLADGRTSIQNFPLCPRPVLPKDEGKVKSKGGIEDKNKVDGKDGEAEPGAAAGVQGEAEDKQNAAAVPEIAAGAQDQAKAESEAAKEDKEESEKNAALDSLEGFSAPRSSVIAVSDALDKAGLPEFLGAPEEDQSDVKGSVTLKGGKAGFEVNCQAARDIVPLPFPSSRPFAIVYWCGDVLGETMVDSRNLRDPQWDETFCIPMLGASTNLEDCTLEIQVWATQGNAQTDEDKEDANYNPDLPHTFLGGVQFTGDDLVHLFTSSLPYACSIRKQLKQSKNVPIKQRKKPTNGVLCLLGGLSGLVAQPGKMLEFSVVMAERIAKLYKVWFSLDWNYVTSYKSPHTRVVNMACEFGERIRLETAAGASTCMDSHLRIDLWESTEGSIGAMDPAYLGMIVIQGQELSDLADQPFAQIKRFPLVLNPSLEPRKQRMIRGYMDIRGGTVMCRCENERVLIIYAARNLARANFGGFGSSDPFVEVHWFFKKNGAKKDIISDLKLVGRTETIDNTLQPVWDETKATYFIPLLQIREYTEKELKKFIKDNEKAEKEGRELRDRTMYDEIELQIAIYDEKGEGEKGLCLGVVRFGDKELIEFFESYEAIEKWYPLTKGSPANDAVMKAAAGKDAKDPATRNASIGTGAEIKLGTTGHRYNSPEARRLEKEAEMAAAAAAAAAAKAEAEALEFARLERELENKLEAEAAEKQRLEEEAAQNEADMKAAEAESERIFKERLAAKKAAEEASASAE